MIHMRVGFFVAFLLYFIPFVPAQSQSIDDYLSARKTSSIQELYQISYDTIQSNPNTDVLIHALQDVADSSLSQDKAKQALLAVTVLVDTPNLSQDAYKEAQLAQATLLARLGEKEEAYATFRTAIQERWNSQCAQRFFELLWENADDDLAAIETYNLAADKYGEETRLTYANESKITRFLHYAHGFKVEYPFESALVKIAERLPVSNRQSITSLVARSFCLAMDGNLEESLKILDDLETTCPNTDPNWLELPLYRSSLLFLQGTDYKAARKAFKDYQERNAENPSHVLDSAIQLCETMGILPNNKRNIEELTNLLFQKEWLADSTEQTAKIPNAPTDEQIAMILHWHQLSLGWQLRQDEARELAKKIMDRYYPQTKGGKYTAVGYGVYLLKVSFNQAERTWLDLLGVAENDNDLLMNVHFCLGKMKWRAFSNWNSLAYLQDALDRMGNHPQSECKRLKEEIDFLKNDILNPPAIKKTHPELFRFRPSKGKF